MAGRKTIAAVVGATGSQGGGRVRAILDDGEYAVRAITRDLNSEKEIAQAENMARAAKEAGVEHVIWSTLEDTRNWVPLDDDRMPTLQDKYKVPHFDGKGEADGLFEEFGVPTTWLLTSFYWDNFHPLRDGSEAGSGGEARDYDADG